MEKTSARRPLKSRQTAWARAIATALARAGISPNTISFLSMVFAVLSLVAAMTFHPILAAICIQLRLLANMMDGMVAVEFGKKSKTGDLWNDVPDRFADFVIILGAGYLAMNHQWGMELAWINGALAIFTAYLRVLGATLGSPQYFLGPMAKPHRMALLTIAYLTEAILQNGWAVYGALIIMVLGQVITCYRRLAKITSDVEKK